MIDGLPYSRDFHVIEFRRYTIKPAQRDHFARYFEAYFPEAFQQLGALAVGEFLEQDHADGFTWIRAFKSIEDRAIVNSAFYYGPVWKEHKATLNGLMVDSDDVLLLTPVNVERGIAILPAVDPVKETASSRGLALAQVFRVVPGNVAELIKQTAATFASYRAAGAHEAAVLTSLDVPNNFPQLPIRTDGPYLVWIGIIADDPALKARLATLLEQSGHALAATGLLRDAPENIMMTPTPRSRLRWRTEPSTARTDTR
jgi:hypothetical protein